MPDGGGPICPQCDSSDTQRRGVRNGVQRVRCNTCSKYFSIEPELDPNYLDFTPSSRVKRSIEANTKFVITSAQNNTPLDKPAWATVNRMADEMGAQLLVLPTRYKNPTSRLDPQDDDKDVWWPQEVEEHLVEGELALHKDLRVLGQVRVAPGAVALACPDGNDCDAAECAPEANPHDRHGEPQELL